MKIIPLSVERSPIIPMAGILQDLQDAQAAKDRLDQTRAQHYERQRAGLKEGYSYVVRPFRGILEAELWVPGGQHRDRLRRPEPHEAEFPTSKVITPEEPFIASLWAVNMFASNGFGVKFSTLETDDEGKTIPAWRVEVGAGRLANLHVIEMQGDKVLSEWIGSRLIPPVAEAPST